MKKFTSLLMLMCAFVASAWAQGSVSLVRVPHDGWNVTAQNEFGSVSGNEGGLAFIEDENSSTFYHSDWSGSEDGKNGKQGFLVEMAETVENICKITYAGRSDNNTSGWASKVRIYVYEELPATLSSLSSLSVAEKDALFANTEVLGTPVFDNSDSPWNKEDKLMKTAEFEPVTGKYILFIQDEGKDNWLTCSDFQVYYQYTGAVCTVNYEFYYNDVKRYTQEISDVVVGTSWPDINVEFPFGVSATKPAGTIEDGDVVDGVVTRKVDLTLGTLPFTASTLTDGAFGEDMSWYFLKMRSKDVTYDAASGKSLVQNVANKIINNLFAFVGNPFDGYSIYNYAAGADKVFWREDDTNAGRVFFTEKSETDGNTWELYANGNAGYVFKLKGTANGWMNDHSTEIAIWQSGWGATDAGSTFTFELVEDLDIVAVEGLKAYITEVEAYIDAAVANGTIGGTTVGYITSTSVTNVEEALAAAKAAATSGTGCVEAQKALEAAVAAVEIILPEEGKFYKIVSACTKDHRAGQEIYVNNDGNMHFAKSDEYGLGVASALARVWQFVPVDGKFYLKNVERGTYMQTVGRATEAEANAKAVTISNMGLQNRVSLKPDGQSQMHAQDANSKIVGWNENNPEDGSAWIITEVSIEGLAHTLTVGAAEWATLILGYNATIPADVTVYAVSSIEGEYAMLTEVEDVIPANTAVLVNAEAGDYAFNYAASAGSVESMLGGSVFNTNVAKESYVLAKPEGKEIGFYEASLNQDENTAFKNNAFKAYLPKPVAGASVLRFDFGGETAIESVEGAEDAKNAVIFDLAGRRVAKAQKGLYIVNGKKVVR